jgi:hypothetical protein
LSQIRTVPKNTTPPERNMIAQTALVFPWAAALNAGAINPAHDV